jgi:hypothetical protein
MITVERNGFSKEIVNGGGGGKCEDKSVRVLRTTS